MMLAIMVREDITVLGKESGRIASNEPEVDPSNKAHPQRLTSSRDLKVPTLPDKEWYQLVTK